MTQCIEFIHSLCLWRFGASWHLILPFDQTDTLNELNDLRETLAFSGSEEDDTDKGKFTSHEQRALNTRENFYQ